MTKEQEKIYNKIVMSGNFDEEGLKRIRANFEKKPRKHDIAKGMKFLDAMDMVVRLEDEVKQTPFADSISVDWYAAGEISNNASVMINVETTVVLYGKAKEYFKKMLMLADNLTITPVSGGKVCVSFDFMDVISEQDNTIAN